MSNLIERLRSDGANCSANDCEAAADEIERLQRALDLEKTLHLDLIGELQDRVAELEGALELIASPDSCSNEHYWMVKTARTALKDTMNTTKKGE